MTRVPCETTDLRLDGYFYWYLKGVEPRVVIYFFYRNGVVLCGEAPKVENMQVHEEMFQSGAFYERVRNSKIGWGSIKLQDRKSNLKPGNQAMVVH